MKHLGPAFWKLVQSRLRRASRRSGTLSNPPAVAKGISAYLCATWARTKSNLGPELSEFSCFLEVQGLRGNRSKPAVAWSSSKEATAGVQKVPGMDGERPADFLVGLERKKRASWSGGVSARTFCRDRSWILLFWAVWLLDVEDSRVCSDKLPDRIPHASLAPG